MNNQEIGLVLQCILFIFTNIYWSHAKSLDVNDETSSADHGFYLHKKGMHIKNRNLFFFFF